MTFETYKRLSAQITILHITSLLKTGLQAIHYSGPHSS